MFPTLSLGMVVLSFLLCNTVLILNTQVLYKEDVSPGTAIGKTPEMMRVKQTQDHISSVKTPTGDSFSVSSASLWSSTLMAELHSKDFVTKTAEVAKIRGKCHNAVSRQFSWVLVRHEKWRALCQNEPELDSSLVKKKIFIQDNCNIVKKRSPCRAELNSEYKGK